MNSAMVDQRRMIDIEISRWFARDCGPVFMLFLLLGIFQYDSWCSVLHDRVDRNDESPFASALWIPERAWHYTKVSSAEYILIF